MLPFYIWVKKTERMSKVKKIDYYSIKRIDYQKKIIVFKSFHFHNEVIASIDAIDVKKIKPDDKFYLHKGKWTLFTFDTWKKNIEQNQKQ